MSEHDSIIVTGGSGLLGSSLVHQLVEADREKVFVMDVNPDPRRLSDIADDIEYIEGDVADPAHLRDTIGRIRPRRIFHLAAFLGDWCEDDPLEGTRININGVQHLFEAACEYEVEQVLFSSSLGVFGYDLEEDEVFTDKTLQRPFSYYGVTKLYAEGAGRWYKRKRGLDYRGIRFPAIVGPGVKAGGIVNYISSMIEFSHAGKPYTVQVAEDTRVAVVHVEDAGNSLIQLAEAPIENIRMVNYLINGISPLPTAGEMAEMVRSRIPGARIDFQPREDWTAIIKLSGRPVDDSYARAEWNWTPKYHSFEKILDSYLAALESQNQGESR
ncbi:MAG TPA: NAD-dependent epimerase/dehydratase family protein, partial [Methylothermaceae bacterium]|nr:NAD-dependent epimerase/dehydratase family protein [Methylothermaceae bacterium]